MLEDPFQTVFVTDCTSLQYGVTAWASMGAFCKVNLSNHWNARHIILDDRKYFPATTARRQDRQFLTWWGKGCKYSSFSALKLAPIVALGRTTSVSYSRFRRCGRAVARGVFEGSPMEDISNAAMPDVKEPALKKQACNSSHVNGHTNGSNGAVVAHSLALRVKKLSPEAVLPSRGSAHAAGYDLSSAYDATVPARGKALIKTELSIAIPDGTYARVAPRSGLAWKHSIDVGAGVIDADYRGPLGVILFNHSDVDFSVEAGDRIAQLILERIVTPDVVEVDDLESTARGEGGFGSTGVAVTPVVVVEAPPS